MAVHTIFLLCICVGLGLALPYKWEPRGETWLPRATARPLDVDPKLDCAIKQLAWEYAKKLLPQVSTNTVFIKIYVDIQVWEVYDIVCSCSTQMDYDVSLRKWLP